MSSNSLPHELGRYRIEGRLGEGAFGVVYLARHRDLKSRLVALKVPRPERARSAAVRDAFREEGDKAARFDHPNLCKVYDYGLVDGMPYLALQYVEGDTLSNVLATPWRAPGPREAVQIVRQLADALNALHEADMLHCDVKPGNVRLTPKRQPVLLDFGLALRLNDRNERHPGVGELHGTPLYMAPEQISPDPGVPLTPACDVYSLGVVLYQLLTRELPFQHEDPDQLAALIRNKKPESLRARLSTSSWLTRLFQWVGLGLESGREETLDSLDAFLERAMAKGPDERFANMRLFADALDGVCLDTQPTTIRTRGMTSPWKRPLIRREAIRFAFAGHGEVAPPDLEGQNRLFLDVGNDLRPGVLDHHHLKRNDGSTASLAAGRLDLIDAAIAPGGADEFIIVLHQEPDLDCVASAYLTVAYLTTGALPSNVGPLLRFVDRLDRGETLVSQAQPFSLAAAYKRLLTRSAPGSDVERWTMAVQEGLKLLDYVVQQARERQEPVEALDAFEAPGLFGLADRAIVKEDLQRYAAKLADPRTNARIARLRLPGQSGPSVEVDALLVREVQNRDDQAGVHYFKDWARSDTVHAPRKKGFTALSVFHPEEPGKGRRCILSVTPESATSLRGLGELLEQAETAARKARHNEDDRVRNPVTGARLDPRPGYPNADPWYDGRAHGYTIVDSPRGGTVLTADQIEQIFLDYGEGKAVPLAPP